MSNDMVDVSANACSSLNFLSKPHYTHHYGQLKFSMNATDMNKKKRANRKTTHQHL